MACLFASPEGPWLDDCRHGDNAIPVLKPHEDIHEHILLNEGVTLGHQPAAQQRVLHNADDRLVCLQSIVQNLSLMAAGLLCHFVQSRRGWLELDNIQEDAVA